jgi:hypothetical protein
VDIADFLRARLDEDEALAREAPPGPWHIGNAVDPTQSCNVHTFPGARMVADGLNWLTAEHIARQNPARVLAEVEAKRRLVKEFAQTGSEPDTPERRDSPHWQGDFGYLQGLARAVHLLASTYADHPDYREEWRP